MGEDFSFFIDISIPFPTIKKIMTINLKNVITLDSVVTRFAGH